MDMDDFIRIVAAILIMSLPFITIILIVGIKLTFRARVQQQRHKEIMFALEKGMPPSEIKALMMASEGGSGWIKTFVIGVFCLIISVGLVIASWFLSSGWSDFERGDGPGAVIFLAVAFVLFAFAVTAILFAMLRRQAELNRQAAQKDAQSESQTANTEKDGN